MLPIKEDDEFFSKIVTKESSIANPSFRVYYGGNSVAVPFVWEAKPGTPKHTKLLSFANEEEQNKEYLPPLTPPPSYYLKQQNNNNSNLPSSGGGTKKFSTKVFLGLIPKSMHRRQISSTSSSSSSTLSCPSSSMLISDSTMRSSESRTQTSKRRALSRSGSLFDFIVNTKEEDDYGDKIQEEEMRSPRSVLCFGFVGSRRIRSCSVA